MKLVIAVLLVAGGLATGMAGLSGWTDGRAGAVIGFLFVAVAAAFAFAQNELADRSVRQGALIGGCVVALVVGLVGLLWLVRPRSSNIVVLDGDLNIAVLPFAIDRASSPRPEGDFGTAYAEGMAASLKKSTGAELSGTALAADVRAMGSAPDLTKSPQELSERAAGLANKARADFVLTGELLFDRGLTSIRPLLYVSAERVPDAPELSGWYEGSAPNTIPADLSKNKAMLDDSYRSLNAAMGTLLRLGLGLEELAADRYGAAVERLEPIEQDGDLRIVTPELASLVLGNALGHEACEDQVGCDDQGLEQAARAYQRAIEHAQGFPRGRVGLAEVALQRGQGDSCRPQTLVDDQLARAESLYQSVVDDTAAPEVASSKALLGLARVDACRAVAGVPGAGERVRGFADTLVERANARRDSGIEHLAAEGRSFQAVTAYVQGRPEEAVDALQEAIDRSVRLERRAHWLSLLGSYLSSPPTCDLARAERSLGDARDLFTDLLAAAVGQEGSALEAQRAEADRLLAAVQARKTCG